MFYGMSRGMKIDESETAMHSKQPFQIRNKKWIAAKLYIASL